MSSGEKQKIAVASVNAVDPEIYVFDEPSANLDMYSVEALKNLMGGLKRKATQSLLLNTGFIILLTLQTVFFIWKTGA